MAQLPRYTKTGIQAVAPVQVRKPAGQRGAIISNEINKMQQFVTQKLAERRTLEAQQAVAEFGDLSILQQISERGGPSSVAERAAYDLANQIGADRVESQARIEIDRIIDDASRNSTPYELVNSQILDAVDGFSSSLSVFNPAVAAQLKTRLESYGSLKDNEYLNAYNNVQQQELLVDFETLQGQRLQELKSIVFNANGEFTDDAINLIEAHKQSILNLNIDQRSKDLQLRQFENRLTGLQIEGQLFALPGDDDRNEYEVRADAIEELIVNGIPNYTEQEVQAFTTDLRQRNNRDREENNRRIARLVRENPGYAAGNEKYLDEDAIVRAAAQNYIDLNINVHNMSNEDLYNQMTNFENELQREGLAQKEIAVIQRVAELYMQEANAVLEARNQDIANYSVVNNNLTRDAFETFAQTFSSGTDIQQTRDTFDTYVSTINSFYNEIGWDGEKKLFPQEYATSLANAISNPELDSNNRLALLDSLQDLMQDNPENYIQLINELESAGLNPSLTRFLELPDNIGNRGQARQLLLESATVDVTTLINTQTINDLDTLLRSDTEEHLQAMLAGSGNIQKVTDNYNDRIDTAITVSAILQGRGINASTANETAINLVFHESVIDGALIPFDLAYEIGETNISSIFEFLKDSEQTAQLNLDPMIITGYNETDREVLQNVIKDNGIFINNNTGDGVYLAIEDVIFQNIVPVQTTDGNFVEYKFADLPGYRQSAQLFTQQKEEDRTMLLSTNYID